MAQPHNYSHQNLQTMYRQPSFVQTKVLSTGKASIPYRHFTDSTYLSRGLSLNRSQSIRKSKPLISENKNQLSSQSSCCLHKPTHEEKLYQRSQTCSSLTTSLTKTINKKLSNVNSDLRQSCSSKSTTPSSAAYLEVEKAGTRKDVSASNVLNAPPSLTTRPPLLRATSAPVRYMHDNSNGRLLANKRKSRRRTANQMHEAKAEESILVTKVQKSSTKNKRVLARAQSLTSEVITLVSLISPENSDSEKEDSSTIVGRRAPFLKKTGKSVSFQETNLNRFHFSSKECSHMLRRGSIAPLAERLRANRPPTAPPVSIFFQRSHNSAADSPAVEVAVSVPNKAATDCCSGTKTLEVFTYPHHVRSHKGRECWKLFLKMSASGVNIAYDTIMRGLLTPTEFRQQQKQRELEEANKFKES
ncbi:uncharacterized protein ACN427_013329 isoform 2-T2 [Glossina fuscipes fuscipes]